MSFVISRVAAAIATALSVMFWPISPTEAQSTLVETHESLPDFPGREETFGYCIGCHSFTVVGRQGMDRGRWDDTLSWMTEKHSMPPPDPPTRKLLLDYLSQAYPTKAPAQNGGWVNPFAPKP
ncbi:MAG: hypothetical protein ACOYOJ_07145 [Alsobacter sp.]